MIHKITIKISLLLSFLFIILFGTTLNAQEAPYIKGEVHDKDGKPMTGVVVISENGKNRTFTDEKGEYTIVVNDKSKNIKFSYIGYKSKKVVAEKSDLLNVVLVPDASNLDETVQLGYSSQRKGDLTGAVSTVSGEELKKSPVMNLSMTFAGRLAGLFTRETYSELSRANTALYVRGLSANRDKGPLVIIDGISSSYNTGETLEYITPSEIESVTVLKDASTEALYGIQGANGVIVITTKKGRTGKMRVNVRLDESIQKVSTQPTFFSSDEYATLRNQAAANDGKDPRFTEEQIANYKSGADRSLYPNTNWYDMYMKKFAQMQRVNVDLEGGNDRIQYFTNVNMMHQGSQFKTDQKDYDTNENFTWADVRSNVTAKLNSYLSAYLNLTGNIKRERTPGGGIFSGTIYNSLFTMPSTVYGPVTPGYTDENGDPQGNQVVATSYENSPTYGMLNRNGYTRYTVTNIYTHFGLNLDMSFLTKGLSASGVFAYQTNTINGLFTTKDYERWVRNADSPDELIFTKTGLSTNSPLSYGRNCGLYYYLTGKGIVNYKRDFGLSHVTGMAFGFYQNLNTADGGSPYCLPYKRLHSGVEATYDYDQKYLLKADLGYSGSDQYGKGNRFITTPAISAGWVVSRESFMNDMNWLSNLKLRASYGKTANDDCGLGRFAYFDNVTFGHGGPLGYLRFTVDEHQTGNSFIQPEVSKKQNYGIDLGFFNELSISVDVFNERMDNMVINASATIPTNQGIPLGNYPASNAGSFKNKGYDITANYNKAINKDLTVFAGGFVSYVKNTVIKSGEAFKSSDYAYQKWTDGYSAGQSFGYLVDWKDHGGYWISQDQINSSAMSYSFRAPRVGDLKYKDLNGDGVIDQKDQAPLGTGMIPRYYYGFSGGLTYKSFDLSVLFQGIGKYSTVEGGMGVYDNSIEGVFGSLHRNAWTIERYANGEKITAPALSLSTSASNQSSDYYLNDRSYLRLKNLEIGYTLPQNIARSISANKIRFVVSAQNLFTWDHMKSDDYGPEGYYSSIPVYKVFNVGVNLQF